VPSVFVLLLRLPVTPNGKVDRDRLPAPTDERPELEEEFALPQSPMERELADIVAAVLGTTMVGANDNFFELGGDSILAIQVAAQAQERGIQLSPLDLFEHPTVALLANVAGATSPPAAPAPTPSPSDAAPPAPDEVASAPPSAADFPLARVDQTQLDALFTRVAADD
jgi:aryl carrier-like protein